MNMHRFVVLSGLVVASQLALAQERVPDPKALATTEAILAYCAKADPAAAPKYQQRVQLITQGSSEESLAKARKSDEYRQALDSTEDFLSKVDAHNAAKVCSQSVAQNR